MGRATASTDLRHLRDFEGWRVARIEFEGARITKDHIIRREMRTRVGRTLHLGDFEADLQRLDNLDIFSSIKVSGQGRDGDVELILLLRELPFAVPYISYDITDEDGLSLGPALKSVNMLGRDVFVAGYLLYGGRTLYLLDFSAPWVAGNHVSFDLDLSRVERENRLDGFREISYKITPRIGTYVADHGRAALSVTYMRVEADRFWYVLADGEIFTWLVAHGMGMDVTVSDPQSWVLQVGGPRSLEVLDAACDGGAPDPFAYFAVTECTMGGQPLYLSRTGWTSEVGWEVYTRDPEVDGPALWNHILEAGKAQEIITTGLDSMNIRCIEAGILDNGSDFDTSMTPYQAGIGKFVDMNKDDFIGKEALAAADRRPLLFGIRCPTAAPSGVSPVTQGDTEVGTITTGAWSPYLGHGTGYVRFHEAGDWLGAAVSVSDVEGQMHVAEVVELPFYDPEKRISRGLDTAIPEGPLAVTQA